MVLEWNYGFSNPFSSKYSVRFLLYIFIFSYFWGISKPNNLYYG